MPRMSAASLTRLSISPAVELAHLEAEGHVVEHAHVRVERVVLEHHGDVAVHRRQVVDHLAVDGDEPRADRLEPGDHPERRGLAAAGRPDEDHELLVEDLQVEVPDGVDAFVELVDVLQDDLSHSLSTASHRPIRLPLPVRGEREFSPSPSLSGPPRSARQRTSRRSPRGPIPAARLPSADPRRTRHPGSAPM